MLDCKELKEKLFHIYGRRIICRVGQGRPVYNATKEITQQPEADIAVYIQEKCASLSYGIWLQGRITKNK